MKVVGKRLTQTRPSMAAIGNMVKRFVGDIKTFAQGFDIHELARRLTGEMEVASREAAQRAAPLVHDGAGVLNGS